MLLPLGQALAELEIELPAAMSEVGAAAYKDTALVRVILPNKLQKIGPEAFSGCTGLRTLYIPASVTEIARDAFTGCTKLHLYVAQGSPGHAWAEASGMDYTVLSLLPKPDTSTYVPKGKIADISKWQGTVNWSVAAKELDFCILRAQYGHKKIDECYLQNARGCDAADIPYGAYSFCLFTDVESAKAEARLFAQRVKGTNPKFLVLDLETGGVAKRDIRKEVSAYVAELRRLGYPRVGAYIAHNAYTAYNVNISELDFVWIPRYGTNSGVPEMDKQPKYACDLWQYTSNGTLAGVSGRVDLNKLMDEERLLWFRGEI